MVAVVDMQALKRNALEILGLWLKKYDRKPIIIRGARQVGKTYLVREFCKQEKLDLIEINFERDISYRSLFDSNDPDTIMKLIEATFGRRIQADKSLLFLDEIQSAPEILAKLRWFAEELSVLPVIATGSLLDFVLADHSYSMPVGRVEYFYLEPFSFTEFLCATGKESLYDFIDNFSMKDSIPEALHLKLMDEVRKYMIVGGMPASIVKWRQSGSFLETSQLHSNLLTTYKEDFTKYNTKIDFHKLDQVINAVPVLLGKKCKYSLISKDMQAVTVKNAISLLEKSRLCHRVIASSCNGIPLLAESKERFFKLIFIDIGLATTCLGITANMLNPNSHFINEGALAEQWVGQALRSLFLHYSDPKLFYWTNSAKGSEAEVDYVIELDGMVVPVEVKSGSTGSLRSLHSFMARKGLGTAIRVNADYPSVTQISTTHQYDETKQIDYELISIPFYLVGFIKKLGVLS